MNCKPSPKRKRSSWFAFYPDDFDGGTRSMSLAGRGAFICLLSHQFANGSVPSDERTICRIIGAFPEEWEPIRAEVLAKFERDESGNLVNPRMRKEREEREGIREKRIEASRIGNKMRWKGDPKSISNGIANGIVLGIATTSTTTSSNSSEEEFVCTPPVLDSETLARQGRSLESISSRLDLPTENFIEHGATLGLSEAKVRQWADSRVSNGWNTGKGKPLTPVTWPADMNSFASASNEISQKHNGKNHANPSRNDGTANAGRAAAFADIGKLRPGV